MVEPLPPFLGLVDPAATARIDGLGNRRRFRSGVTVMAEGDAAGRVGVIRSGLVKLVASHPDGFEAVLAVRGPGELLGEVSVFDHGPRSASVVTMSATEVQFIDGPEFVTLVKNHPSVAIAVIRTLSSRLRASDEDRVSRGADGVDRRLARELLQLSSTYGVVAPSGAVEITLPFSQTDLAAVVGASRDAVARSLRVWRDQGLVETARRRVTLLEPSGLSRRYRF